MKGSSNYFLILLLAALFCFLCGDSKGKVAAVVVISNYTNSAWNLFAVDIRNETYATFEALYQVTVGDVSPPLPSLTIDETHDVLYSNILVNNNVTTLYGIDLHTRKSVSQINGFYNNYALQYASNLRGIISTTVSSISLINPSNGNILESYFYYPGFENSGLPGCTFIRYPLYATYFQDVTSQTAYLLQYNLRENRTVKLDALDITCCVFSPRHDRVYAIQQNFTGTYFFGEVNMETYKFTAIVSLPDADTIAPVAAYDREHELYWFYDQKDVRGNQVLFALDPEGRIRYHFDKLYFQQPNLGVY